MPDVARPDVMFDLCVQREYLSSCGVRPCLNAAEITPNLKQLIAFARLTGVRVLSCVDTRRPNDIGADWLEVDSRVRPEERKAPFSLLPDHGLVESDNCLSVALDILNQHQQTIFTKYHRDPYTNPKLDRLLTEMPAGRFVVFGMPLETSLRILVLGLIRRGRSVVVIDDACGYWDADQASLVLRQLHVKGALLMKTEPFIRSEFDRAKGLTARVRSRRSVA
ncbi:MAG: cysteine hydrolase [Phycisphaerae bacterium]|nr:isochorismatase family protein [Phycisphaerae bacterium]MCZ2401432.1 cysteine hydrolase [Phycisphaerae bacterium]NUQ49569.1 isochorismatase family protein [Phycisphaerae bacterium]